MAATRNKIWFVVHGWLSLPVWLLFCFICITGTIAVISHELTWLTNPAARAGNPGRLPAKPIPELVAKVEAAIPGSQVTRVMVLEPYLVNAIGFVAKDQPPGLAYVNQYTGDIQTVNHGLTFIGFMRTLHGWLFLPWQHAYSIGYYLVSAMSIVTLGAMITGMVVYKRFWRAYTRPMLRFGKGLRVALGDLHRLFGAWSLWFLLLMGLTGLWYLTQAILWHNAVEISEPPAPVPLNALPVTDGTSPRMISLDQAYDRAMRILPSLTAAWVTPPEHSRDYFTIAGSGDALLFDQYSYQALIDPWSGNVVDVHTPSVMNTLEIISHIADPLHYGTFGGLWTKAIWFLFGLGLSAMSVTGFVIYGRRTTSSMRPASAPAALTGADTPEGVKS